MGKVDERSDRSYEILTENGLIVSKNRIHLRETNVVLRECAPISNPITGYGTCKAESVMAPKLSPVPKSPQTISPSVKTIKSTIDPNDNSYRMQSGRVVRKPTRYQK